MATLSESRRATALKLVRNARQLRGSVAQDLRRMAASYTAGLTDAQSGEAMRTAMLLERIAEDLEALAAELEVHPPQRRGQGV